MIATVSPCTCGLLIADRGFHRLGLTTAIKEAGFKIREHRQEQMALEELGLLEMDLLLEIEAVLSIADFFPSAFRLKTWKPLLCARGWNDQPILVLTRKEGQDPNHGSNQELITMLQSTIERPRSQSIADTVADLLFPSGAARGAGGANLLPYEIAHDLNNFLTIIRGNSQLLLENIAPPELTQQLTQEISKASEQAALLINQLAAVANSEEQPAHQREIGQLLNETAGMLRNLLGPQNRLVLEVDPHPCPVEVVPGQLERVFINLATNARDAMPHGGQLTIRTEFKNFQPPLALSRTFVSGPHVVVTIADTGTGIEDRVRAHLFRPHHSHKPQGKGLGLSIVSNILKQHHGHLEVASAAGQGTTFSLYLPLALPEKDVAMHKPLPPEKNLTVLLVEDEAMVRSIFRRILQENNYFVIEAGNGMEAIDLAKNFAYPIHLLITDLAMPKMNGIQLAEEMGTLHPETQVLYLSGYSEGALPGQPPPEKKFAFLQKPFKAKTLLQKIEEIMQAAS